jgi:UDP-N-acetylglucosamine--N-acetylmuramyl-(pentapeptide) pyrophosphoryl-undecaprenol N-acetylglucosamine transferase
MSVSRNFVLAAGGTGGHIIPAYALGAELMRRGHQVALITDNRGSTIPGCPEAWTCTSCPPGVLQVGPRGWLAAARNIWRGRAMARALFERIRSDSGGRFRRLSGAACAARGLLRTRCRQSSTNRMPCWGG